jgi:hypothetical protein
VGRAVGQAATPDRAFTEVMKVDADPAPPVFVDASGARRRRLRHLVYGLGAVAILVLLALWLSQFGGTVRPDPAVPCPSAAAGADREGCR